jgi:hypothetical protein
MGGGLISPAAGSLIAGTGNDRNVEELRRLERVCLEQAELCETPEGKAALLSMAADYRLQQNESRRQPRRVNRAVAQRPSGKRDVLSALRLPSSGR